MVGRGRNPRAVVYVREGVSDKWQSVAARGHRHRAACDQHMQDQTMRKCTSYADHLLSDIPKKV